MFITLGVILTYIISGIHMIRLYFKYHSKALLDFGISVIAMSSLWWSSFLNKFVIFLLPSSDGLSAQVYVMLLIIAVPFIIYFFISTISELLSLTKILKWFVISVFIGISVLLFFISVLDYSILVEKTNPHTILYTPLYTVFSFATLFTILIFGFAFSIHAWLSDDQEVKIKGKIITIALSILAVLIVLENGDFPFLFLLVVRISSGIVAILLYLGFTLPRWLKKILL